jgi:hypothetical protein
MSARRGPPAPRLARLARLARTSRLLLATLLALPALAGTARADQEAGIVLTRRAQAALAAGDGERALELLAQARVEWPGSPVVANTIADAQRELGRYAEALAEYERGMRDEYAHHALFNRAVTRHRMAETGLGAAGVPADVAALPEGPQPDMLQAIERALPELAAATDDFLEALDRRQDDAARQSVAALNRRTDALRAMQAELRRRQQEQEQDDEEDGQDQPQDEPQDQDEQDPQQEQDPQDQPQDTQDPSDQQDQQDQPQDQPQEQPQDQESQEPQPQDEAQASPRELSPEEVQRLLDRLEQLEQEARAMQKAREAAQRQAVEKDW